MNDFKRLPKPTDTKDYRMIITDSFEGTTKEIDINTNWEGLSLINLVNMFRQYLLMVGWSDENARGLRIISDEDMKELGIEEPQISEFDFH